jgi:hypothetical protein
MGGAQSDKRDKIIDIVELFQPEKKAVFSER